jgi:hypothetical protein
MEIQVKISFCQRIFSRSSDRRSFALLVFSIVNLRLGQKIAPIGKLIDLTDVSRFNKRFDV